MRKPAGALTSMDRRTLYFRLSLVWLAILVSGVAVALFML
jgi:hypothetical protein